MSKLDSFIEKNDVLFSKNLVTEDIVKEIESVITTKLGPKLREYILKYGFLSFKHVELYGINSKQGINSDMIKMTSMMHERYPSTKSMVVLENRGDGDFILIDENDNAYEFDINIDTSTTPLNLNKEIFDYIIDRFHEV